MEFNKILEPGRIGSMEVRNRTVYPPIVTNMSGLLGEVSDAHIEYYSRIAEGGTGLIIVEAAYVMPNYADPEYNARATSNQIGIYANNLIPQLNRLAKAIKDRGAGAVIQLHHGGRQAHESKYPPAASPVYEEITGNSPRELTIDEIEQIEDGYADAAVRAAQAGFDGIELHGANGYLIANFLSGATNKRTDAYGGSLENRMRFGLNILRKIREKVGRKFPIIWRASAMETLPGGLTFDEVKIVCREVERGGADCIHMTCGGYGFTNVLKHVQPNSCSPGILVPYAEELKRDDAYDLPIITVGKINNPFLASEIVEQGKADFVAIGRGIIADPDFAKKMAESRPEDIRKCICCTVCLDSIFMDNVMSCSVNPLVGREGENLEIEKAEKAKKVMVVGGGPAGMEVSRVCALRGHDVMLYDKGDEIGGKQLKLACTPPHKEDMKHIAEYYSVQLEKLGVKITLGVEVNKDLVDKIKPDAVILATGAKPSVPQIPGVENKNVVTAWDVLDGKAEVGPSAVIVGGGLIGCDTLELLLDQGKNVTITTRQSEIAYNMEFINKFAFLLRLSEKTARIETETECLRITDTGIVGKTKWGKEITIEADTIILASGSESVDNLKNELKDRDVAVHVIGDAKERRKIINAISEGFILGRNM